MAELTNAGQEVEGRLIVETAEPAWSARTQNVVPLTLPAGAHKRVPVVMPVPDSGSKVEVRFEADGRAVARTTLTLGYIGPAQALVGVLSGDELGVPGLNLVKGNRGIPNVVARLDSETFPTRASLLRDYNLIALSRFDSGTLSEQQLRALESWVGQGGTLLLVGGPEWKRTLDPMPRSLVPVAIEDVRQVDLSPLGESAGRPLSATGPVSVARLLKGTVLVKSGDVPLLTMTPVGAGRVYFLAVDPALEPMVTWRGQGDLFARYLDYTRTGGDNWWDNRSYQIQRALELIPGLGLPSLWLVFGLLLGYVLLVGPLNYFLLKRLDRREWTWVTVPALSVLFVGVVWSVTLGTRTALISHLITVTKLIPGTDTAMMTSYVGVYAPTKERLEVPLVGDSLVRPVQTSSPGSAGKVGVRIVAGERTRVELLGLTNYEMRSLAVEQDVTIPGGGLELVDVDLTETGLLKGRLVNRLDQPLSDVRVAFGNDSAILGDLAPGTASEPFRLSLGISGRGPLYDPMRAGGDIEMERRTAVLQGLYGWGAETLPQGVLVVTGWASRPLAEPPLPDLGNVHSTTHLVHTELPIPVDATSGNLPPGVVTGVLTEGNAFDRSPVGMVLPEGSYTFRLYLPELDPDRVAELKLHIPMTDGNRWSAEVKNQRTGQWEALMTVSEQPLPNWPDLISDGGVMEVRITVTGHLEMAPLTISARGVYR